MCEKGVGTQLFEYARSCWASRSLVVARSFPPGARVADQTRCRNMASSADQKSGTQISGAVQRQARDQSKAISEAMQGNLELQAILLLKIDEYKQAKADGTFQATPKKKVKKEKQPDTVRRQKAIAEARGKTLNRNQSVFTKWSVELLRALLAYIDPSLPWAWLCLFCMKERFLEMLEFALDMVIISGKPDRLCSLECSAIFDKVKRLYEANGHRVRALVDECDSGFIDWRRFGHFACEVITVEAKQRLQMKCISLDPRKWVLIDEAVTNGDDSLDAAVVKNNFAIKAAFVATTNDTYNASHFFPQLARGLRRRLSEDVGVTSRVPGGTEMHPVADLPRPTAGHSARGSGAASSTDAAAATGAPCSPATPGEGPIGGLDDEEEEPPSLVT